MKKALFPFPEGHDFSFVPGGPRLLQAVDFPLHVGALPVVAQALEGADAPLDVGGGAGLSGDVLDERGFSFT